VGWRSLNEWPTQWPSYETPTGTYLYAVICTGNDRCRVTRRRLHTRNPSPSLSVRCPRSLAQIAPHAAYLASVGGAERRVFRFCAVSCTPRRHPYLQTPSTGGVRSLAAPPERGFHSSDMPLWSDYPGPPVAPRTARSGRDQLCCAERSSPVWVEQVPDRERHRGVYSPVCPCVPTAAEANVMAPQRRRTMGVGWCGVGRPCETHTHLSVQGGRTWRSACSVCSHTRGDLALQPSAATFTTHTTVLVQQ
jgi:hypothetical protein